MFNKIKERKRQNEINQITIERLLEAIFLEEELTETEIDVLLEQYPEKMNKISFKNFYNSTFNNKNSSAKIGFKKDA